MRLRDYRLALRLRRNGARRAALIMRSARHEGVPLSWAFALVEQESGFRNIFGCDHGSILCHKRVTRRRVQKLLAHIANGGVSNGVGLTQLTYPPFIRQAESQGGAHRPGVQLRVGFRVLRDVTKADYAREAWRYNGARVYQAQIAAKEAKWRRLVNKPFASDSRWSGCRRFTNLIIAYVEWHHPAIRVTSRKRWETFGNPGSDHFRGNRNADAADFGTEENDLLKNQLAEELGLPTPFPDYGRAYTRRGSRTYRHQLIAGTHGTGPHLHYGVRDVTGLARAADERLAATTKEALLSSPDPLLQDGGLLWPPDGSEPPVVLIEGLGA